MSSCLWSYIPVIPQRMKRRVWSLIIHRRKREDQSEQEPVISHHVGSESVVHQSGTDPRAAEAV